MIRASIYGRLGRDPVGRTTRTGMSMTTASLAVDVARAGEDEDTEWVSVIPFGATVEALGRQQKGDLITMMGPLYRSRFSGHDGQERVGWSLTVDAIVSARTMRPGGQCPVVSASRPTYRSQGSAVPSDRIDDLFLGEGAP